MRIESERESINIPDTWEKWFAWRRVQIWGRKAWMETIERRTLTYRHNGEIFEWRQYRAYCHT